jgi:DNA adenine methylase
MDKFQTMANSGSILPKPALRWAGSKRYALPSLLALTPPAYNRYIEPFAGSAIHFLALNPLRSTLGDINPHVIALYRHIAKNPEAVANLLHSYPANPETYYEVRSEFDPIDRSIENSVRFLYLNRLCFNGLYRTNRSGHFNVPYGSRLGTMPTTESLQILARRLRRCQLRDGDYKAVLRKATVGDFAYLDPPYFESNRNPHGEYGYGTFRHGDLNEFIEVARELGSNGVQVLISYKKDSKLERSLRDWQIHPIKAQRFVAAKASNRTNTTELLISNFRR